VSESPGQVLWALGFAGLGVLSEDNDASLASTSETGRVESADELARVHSRWVGRSPDSMPTPWQEWQGSVFVRVRSGSLAQTKTPETAGLSERVRTGANGRSHLPCRRSRVRVPSSAFVPSSTCLQIMGLSPEREAPACVLSPRFSQARTPTVCIHPEAWGRASGGRGFVSGGDEFSELAPTDGSGYAASRTVLPRVPQEARYGSRTVDPLFTMSGRTRPAMVRTLRNAGLRLSTKSQSVNAGP
jgi:hypothetical protein